MSWDYIVSQGIDLFVEDRIDKASADRQKKTAWKILARLGDQPGVILADEVGMGKTFVALTVGVSIALQNPDAGPVVVMVPSSVKDKWPRDFKVFFDKCMKPAARQRLRGSNHTLESGVEFLKVLDDPPETRAQIVFMTHGALSRGLTDPWVKLALVKHVCSKRQRTDLRDLFPRFAGRLLRKREVKDEVWDRLLGVPPGKWKKTLADMGIELDDDPVPDALIQSVDDISKTSITAIVDALDQIPRRESANSEDRLKEARTQLNDVFQEIWSEWLAAACGQDRVRLPLLILDEAHHLKNSATKLASLLGSEESTEDARVLSGPLKGVFERMLFLTATPFQLGHGELLSVLERFNGIAWTSQHAPSRTGELFRTDVADLRLALDAAQLEAVGLERSWARLRREHLVGPEGAMTPENWWSWLSQAAEPPEGLTGDVLARYRATEAAMRRAEGFLQPWVIRHLKPRMLASTDAARRRVLAGAAILDDAAGNVGGLEINRESLLPFLLAARAQASLVQQKAGRALFAEGLASSFEAYRDTRNQAEARDEDEGPPQAEMPSDVAWYLDNIEEALPRDRDDATASHPKVRATVARVIELWKSGEKVLVFCHYRATGKALERHLSRAMDDAITEIAARRFACSPADAVVRLEKLGKRFNQLDDVLRTEADRLLAELVAGADALTPADRDEVVDVMRRFLRTPSFLARFFPAEAGAGAIALALEEKDASGLTLRGRLESLVRFLAVRCTPEERAEYLAALGHIQTGERYGREDLDGREGADHAKLLPNVRLANGSTADATRRRLLLAFNTPLFPEVLVASSVLAEGVDLHLDCRFVIHHDLCWNPSTLEQRTGRVDRLGAKAERAAASIHVYLPYVAATQDEKMFRVVQDRERWFQVVLGEKFDVDEAATEKDAGRVPLPPTIGESLGFKLGL